GIIKEIDRVSQLAIVILNWNGQNWLQKFLPDVVKYSPGADIFVIDNASTDNSVSFLNESFPMVKVVQNEKNFGFAGGYNEGLKNISADIYCLLNSDVDRKSTRLNSSHVKISYAVFCL